MTKNARRAETAPPAVRVALAAPSPTGAGFRARRLCSRHLCSRHLRCRSSCIPGPSVHLARGSPGEDPHPSDYQLRRTISGSLSRQNQISILLGVGECHSLGTFSSHPVGPTINVHFDFFKPGFPNHGPIEIGGQIIRCCEELSYELWDMPSGP